LAKVPIKRAPAIGEHSAEILQEAGFEAAEIEAMLQSGVIRQD
ncbi:MAG: crotonobetainyl-CoA:carnitine CoA-transferase CaiB-like acyl-CoA transferase, partial [Candidatus Azotimanducaceae bacterium]